MDLLKRFSPYFKRFFEARQGIPKNLSSQVLGEVRVNFFGWIPTEPLYFVNRRTELFRKFSGRLRMILCYWKTFSVPKVFCPRDSLVNPIFSPCAPPEARRWFFFLIFVREICREFWWEFCGIFSEPQNKGSKFSGKISEHFSYGNS